MGFQHHRPILESINLFISVDRGQKRLGIFLGADRRIYGLLSIRISLVSVKTPSFAPVILLDVLFSNEIMRSDTRLRTKSYP